MGISSIEHLQAWWEAHENPYFVLYGGHSKKSSDLILSNKTVGDKDESFKLLRDTIFTNTGGMATGGKFIVLAKLNAGDNTGFTVKLNFPRTNQNTIGAQIGAVNPYPNLVSAIGAMPMVNGRSVEEHTRLEIEKEREKWEMERRLESLEAALNEQENPTIQHKLISGMLENPDVAVAVIDTAFQRIIGIAGMLRGNRPPIAMAGFEQQGQEPQTAPEDLHSHPLIENDEDDGGYAWVGEKEEERLDASLIKIQNVFPDVLTFLEKVADFVEKNPDMAKMYFNANS